MPALPDFIIAGAPKCGTTALAYFLGSHPEVCISRIKEPRFFTVIKGSMEKSIGGNGPRLSGNFDKGFDWYASLFEEALPDQLKGEASTVYFCNEDAAQLIYDNAPDVKLIFMLRDPVKRVYSHYWQEHKLGFDFPPFEEMVKTNNPRLIYYKKVSDYKTNLLRYFSLFKPEQILIIIQEEFEKNTTQEYERVQQFLGLQLQATDFSKKINEQLKPKSRNLAKMLTVLQSSSVKKLIPEKVLRKAGQLRQRLFEYNAKPFKYPPMPQNIYSTMRGEYEDTILFAEKITGRKIEDWAQKIQSS